jgi:hypothetical protein
MNFINSGLTKNYIFRFGYTEGQAGDIIVIPYLVAALATIILGVIS